MPQPFGPPELCFTEQSPSDLPGAVIGDYGKGRTIHVPFMLDGLYMDYGLAEHRGMIAMLAIRYGPPQRVTLSSHSRVELTIQRQEETGKLLVHLVNYSGQNDNVVDDAIPLHGLELRLTGGGATAAHALVADARIEIHNDASGCQILRLPPVGAFEAISITMAKPI
jgi:hypothetical protein